MTAGEFEQVVQTHHSDLYWFALALTRNENEARELTQETFYIWARKGGQVQDRSRLRSWLFTVLRREFLRVRRHEAKFPEVELFALETEPAELTVEAVDRIDAERVMELLGDLEEPYRVPLVLFYLEDFSYKQIAALLELPVGTVMSRLARGKEKLRRLLTRERDLSCASTAGARGGANG